MSLEEMYTMIEQIQKTVIKLDKLLSNHLRQQPGIRTENRIMTGPEMREILGVSETHFLHIQKRMPFLFRYSNSGTLRAWRTDFEKWIKTEYQPKV